MDWLKKLAVIKTALEHLGDILDSLQLLPRLSGLFCVWWAYHSYLWFVSLPDPSNAQAGYAGGLSLALVGVFKFWFEHEREK